MTDKQKEDKGKLVAVADGVGDSAAIDLYRELDDSGDNHEPIPWPDDCPDWIVAFLEGAGYEVVIA